MTTNAKKVLISDQLAPAARQLLEERDDVEPIYFSHLITAPDFLEFVGNESPASAFVLGATRISEPELEAAQQIQVCARIGVGYDAIDIPALNKRQIPLMTAGTANSPSVAEQALFMMMALAKRANELDTMVKEGRWHQRLSAVPFDLFEKTVLIVGFGRIGTRTAKRCLAMDMNVLIYDPYVANEVIQAAGCEAVDDLDAALPQADFVSIHCPKNPETIGMFNAGRLSRMKPTSYLVNTARGGIIDEADLHKTLSEGGIAGAGLDVFATEPASDDNPLFKLANVITAPHMAGVTSEALHRMSLAAVKNVFSVFDGAPNMENVINKEVYE